MQPRRRAAAILSAILLAACAPTPTVVPTATGPGDAGLSSAGESTPGPGESGTGPAGSGVPIVTVPSAADPVAAADAVLDAADDTVRYAAVLGLLGGVRLGVYAPDGHPVVAGAERSADDVWIYDFEALSLSFAVRDGDTTGLDDLSAQLAELAGTTGEAGRDGPAIEAAIEASARTVEANPSTPRAYAMAAAIELERRGPAAIDLGAPPPDSDVSLDALSAFLITLDVALPVVASRAADGVAFDGRVAGAAGAPQPVAASGCLSSAPSGIPGEWIAGVDAGAFSAMASVANASFNRYLQAQLVGSIVEAKLTGPDAFHHVHQDEMGDVPEDPQGYTYQLRIRPGAPTAPIACGPLQGTGFPPSSGEIVNAKVDWFHTGLEDHTEIITTEEVRTGAGGTAHLEFEPKVEKYPSGIGPEVKQTITIAARTNVLQALGTDLYTKLAGVPAVQTRNKRVEISWHRQYRVEIHFTSDLKITQGVLFHMLLGDTVASGVLNVVDFHAAGAAAQPPYIGQLVNPGTLDIHTTAGPNVGKCNAEWIKPKAGSASIDWQVDDLQLWPLSELSVRLENGPNNELPDIYAGKVCAPGVTSNLGPNPGSSWESYIYIGHPAGLLFTGFGSNAWELVGTDQTWAAGGTVAHWHSQETCGGRCDGYVDMFLDVIPLKT